MKHEVNINTKEESLSEVIAKVSGLVEFLPEGLWQISIGKPKRTLPQNSSLHKYCDLRAKQLNDCGHTKLATLQLLKNEMPWSHESVKNDIWRNFQIYMGFPESTAKLNTTQIQEVFEHCTKFFDGKLGLEHISWPSREDLEREKHFNKN